MKRHNTVALLQARVHSSRLPGKVLMSLQGKPVIGIMLERLKRSKELDGIVVVTSTKPANNAIEYVAQQYEIPCFRGSEKDVLDRYYQASLSYGVNHIVRLTGDCPLIDTDIIDNVIKSYYQSNVDLAVATAFPDGLDVCVFSFNALELAWKNAKLASEREHVVPWIFKRTQLHGKNLHKFLNSGTEEILPDVCIPINETSEYMFQAIDYSCPENLRDERWTIDEPDDFIFLQELSKSLSISLVDASWQDILQTLNKYPEIRVINKHILRDEGYRKSLTKDMVCL